MSSMKEIDFMSVLHKSTLRDYISRVNDKKFPKAKAATLAKKFAYDYWDGDRRICYGGYNYIKGRWEKVASSICNYYKLPQTAKILDVGCGKGYLLYDFLKVLPKAQVYGLDISQYAIENGKEEIKERLQYGNAKKLPWSDNYFDLVISINTLHNFKINEIDSCLSEIERTGKSKFICVESYRNEYEQFNLQCWALTAETIIDVKAWKWIFKASGYSGDYEFIYFE